MLKAVFGMTLCLLASLQGVFCAQHALCPAHLSACTAQAPREAHDDHHGVHLHAAQTACGPTAECHEADKDRHAALDGHAHHESSGELCSCSPVLTIAAVAAPRLPHHFDGLPVVRMDRAHAVSTVRIRAGGGPPVLPDLVVRLRATVILNI